jgi:hypothetical protein
VFVAPLPLHGNSTLARVVVHIAKSHLAGFPILHGRCPTLFWNAVWPKESLHLLALIGSVLAMYHGMLLKAPRRSLSIQMLTPLCH